MWSSFRFVWISIVLLLLVSSCKAQSLNKDCLATVSLLENKVDSLGFVADSLAAVIRRNDSISTAVLGSLRNNLNELKTELDQFKSGNGDKKDSEDGLEPLNKIKENQAVLQKHMGKHYTVFIVDPSIGNIHLYNKLNGDEIHNFRTIKRTVTTEGKELVFAMNAGMYKRNHTALGLLVAEGEELSPINLKKQNAGSGNFYDLQPSGVFAIDNNGRPYLMPSDSFNLWRKSASISTATQSGPMMVINSEINSQFTKGSKNLNVRNAVGITDSGLIVFAISNQPVNFYEFSHLFIEKLGCTNALYLDGVVSRMYLPEVGLNDLGNSGHLGPIIAVVK